MRKETISVSAIIRIVRKLCGKNVKYLLVTEAFGHGICGLLTAVAARLEVVAYSDADNKEDFTKQVAQIYNNLCFFVPNLRKATWEEREELSANGWNFRQDLIAGNFPAEIWQECAKFKLQPVSVDGLPAFAGLSADSNIHGVIQGKWETDGLCGVSAQQQSILPKFFDFMIGRAQLVFLQHFHKVNDLDKVQALAAEFNAYVPGMTEDNEVFGIRGVQHKMYWNLYNKLSGCVGIAGTHTWYLLACRPEVPQIILFNKKGVERWKEIEAAYQAAGYPIFCFGFDETTDMTALFEEVKETYQLFFPC